MTSQQLERPKPKGTARAAAPRKGAHSAPPLTPDATVSDTLDYLALIVTGLLIVLLALRAPLAAREVGLLAFLALVPGRAIVSHLPSIRGPVALALTIASGLSATILLATGALWAQAWYPRTLFAVEVGGACLSIGIALHRRDGIAFPVLVRSLLGRAGALGRRLVDPVFVPLLAGLALWGVGITHTDLRSVGQYGLLLALPKTYYVGLVLLLAGAAWLLTRGELEKGKLAFSLLALIVALTATAALVYVEPRYPYLYKHIGVIQYLNAHGSVNESIDIYQNYPGFFALMAWFDRVVGAGSPIHLAAWSEPVVMAGCCLALFAAARGLGLSERQSWAGLFIFTLSSWVDQVYFSPQAVGYLLSLAILAALVTYCRGERQSRLVASVWRVGAFARRIARTLLPARIARAPEAPEEARPVADKALIILVLFVFAVLVFTHELSPYVVAVQASVLMVLGKLKPRLIAFLFWALAFLYLAPHFAYINKAYGVIASLGDFLSNVATQRAASHRPYASGVILAEHASWVLTALVAVMATVGLLRRFFRREPCLALVCLAGAPIFTYFLTNYDGEATYRVFFFAVPWLALLASSGVVVPMHRLRLWRLFVLLASFGLLLAAFLPAYFGLDELYVVQPSEVIASQYFYSHAKPGSQLLPAGPDFPLRVSARYYLYDAPQSQLPPDLVDLLETKRYVPLGASSLTAVDDIMDKFGQRGKIPVYVLFGATGAEAVTYYHLAPHGSFLALKRAMEHSPHWRVVYRRGSAALLEYRPPVTAATKASSRLGHVSS